MSDHDLVSRGVEAEPSTSGPALRGPRAEREADIVAERVVDALHRSGPYLPGTSTSSSRAQRSARARGDAPAATDRDALANDAPAGAPPVQRSAVVTGDASSSDRQRVVRRAPGHFSPYLASKDATLDPKNNATDRRHLLASWLLDQNIDDLEAMVTGNSEPDLQNVAFLTKIGHTRDDAKKLLLWIKDQAGSTSPTALLQTLVQHYPTAITKRVSGVRHQGHRRQGGQRDPLARAHRLGCRQRRHARDKTRWPARRIDTEVRAGVMKTIEQHHPSTNATSLYVRGHLLNYNIGGPGLDYNMVPIENARRASVDASSTP